MIQCRNEIAGIISLFNKICICGFVFGINSSNWIHSVFRINIRWKTSWKTAANNADFFSSVANIKLNTSFGLMTILIIPRWTNSSFHTNQAIIKPVLIPLVALILILKLKSFTKSFEISMPDQKHGLISCIAWLFFSSVWN